MQAPVANDIRQAASRIEGGIRRTPVLTSRGLDGVAGFQCFLKAENFQRTGSFKLRGAMNFIRQIPEDRRSGGVVAYSSGNHAQAVAYASRQAGIRATIVMPQDAPKSKVQATRDFGADVVLYDRLRENREQIGKQIAIERGAMLVPPYDHPWTIAGQGTLAIELFEESGPLDTLLVCLGGGGMLSGCAIIGKDLNPSLKVYGVEPELANDYALSLAAGEPIEVKDSTTIADGLRTPRPGDITFPIIQRLVDAVILVSEAEIVDAVRFAMSRLKIILEPSGAVCLAAVLSGKVPGNPMRLGMVLSGGNVDLHALAKWMY